MKTWEELVNGAKELAAAAGRKASDMADLAKMKLKLAENEKAIETTLAAIGRLLYDARRDEAPLQEDTIEELMGQVDELTAANEQLQASIDNTRSRKTCVACGAANPEGAAFCNKCGKPL